MPGDVEAGDEELQYVAVRRPIIEWAMRRAVANEALIDVRADVHVTGLEIESGRVARVGVDGGALDADLVVDALGRRTPTAAWLAAAGVAAPPTETNDCQVIYYSRYYRTKPGRELPDGQWLLSPRGDLGYFGFASFPGDNGTFAAVLAVPTGAREWRALKDAAAFEAAVAQIPLLRMWADPSLADPITDVLPMAGLANTLRDPTSALAAGVIPIGDALAHTDPVLAHGLAFGIMHAADLAAAVQDHADPRDTSDAFAASAMPLTRERFEFATAFDAQRHRMWMGETVDFRHRDGDYALFSMLAGGVAALHDAEVFRVFVRRIGLLDSVQVLDEDVDLQRRIEERFASVLATPRASSGPSRDEMLSIIEAASLSGDGG